MALRDYVRKRKFGGTPEPTGRAAKKIPRGQLFVIQKHAARRLHYDLRFQAEGVLKSWAVPKGLPLEKGEKHLAIHVEDHPLDYATFEGVIPAGNYGAGSVMVWDLGTYEVEEGNFVKALRSGRIHFSLQGKKLRGEWSLVRMRARGDKDEWLVIKHGSNAKALSARREDSSALSQRNMKTIAAGGGKVAAPDLEGTRREVPKFIVPMKALLVEIPPTHGEWLYEIKFDGMRVIAVKSGRRVHLYSRTRHDVTGQFGAIAAAIRNLPGPRATFDGEVVVLDESGRSSFQLLQPYMQSRHAEATGRLFYYLFDLLNQDGRDLRELPVETRKELLKALLPDKGSPLRFSDSLTGSVDPLLRETKRLGLEGLIGKRRGSIYEPDRRSGAWIKLKTVQEQEFVIGGYTEPKGSRQYFGSLLVGYYEKGRLRFASKVGTGFDEAGLKELHDRLTKLERRDSPFISLPSVARICAGNCTWLKPVLVCQVRFSEWTRDGGLRQPVFLGLRTDKPAKDVRRERPTRK